MIRMKGLHPTDQATLRRSMLVGLRIAVRDLDSWQDPELIEDATVCVEGVGQFSLRAHTDDLYHVLPSREKAVATAIKERLDAGATFVDAGANIGFYSVLGSRIVGASGRVIAIEMMPDTAMRLRQHLRMNDLANVSVLEHPLSDTSGQEIEVALPEHKHGRASMMAKSGMDAHRTLRLRTRTLDELLAECGPVDLIKMDLESAEPLALAGAPQVLSRTRAVIFEQLSGESRAADLLTAAGFTLNQLDGSNVIATRPDN